MPTEYDNIDVIGRTHESSKNSTEEKMNSYYHKQEVNTVTELLQKLHFRNFESVVDLGCSVGTWYADFKNFGFKKIIGIDISEQRAEIAEKRGYSEIHVCNAYELPFDNGSQSCVISNDVLIHVLQDNDKLRIFKEVKRILKKEGTFIFNFSNALGSGFRTDTTIKYCRWNTPNTISNLVNDSGLNIEHVVPSYYTIPRIGAHPYIVSFSTKFTFLLTDLFLKITNNLSLSKVIYFGVRKKEQI